MSKFVEFSFSLRDDDSDDSDADGAGEVSIAVDSDGRIARPALAAAATGAKRAAAAGPQRVQGCDFGTRAYDALPALRDNPELLERLRDDCQAVFTSESFWLPRTAKPTCALEQLALGAPRVTPPHLYQLRTCSNSCRYFLDALTRYFPSTHGQCGRLGRPVWR